MNYLYYKCRYKLSNFIINKCSEIEKRLRRKLIKYHKDFQNSCKHINIKTNQIDATEHITIIKKCLDCEQVPSMENKWK
jgi:hypothetical protein